MLAYILKCPKHLYALKNNPKQQVLDFDKKSNKTILIGSTQNVHGLKECRKAIFVLVICDEQPFTVVEGYDFKYMYKRLKPQLHVPLDIL